MTGLAAGEKAPGRNAGWAAYAASVLFLANMVLVGAAPGTAAGYLVGVAAHLLLFPVVAALPAPSWARAAGYGWLVLDVAASVEALNGVAETDSFALRLGGHVAAAVWILSASWEAKGWLAAAGAPLGLLLGAYSLVAPWGVPVGALVAGFALLVAWLALAGRQMFRPSPFAGRSGEGRAQDLERNDPEERGVSA